MQNNFSANLSRQVKQTSPVVVGLDPNFDLMPEQFQPKSNDQIEQNLWQFCKEVIDASYDLVCGIKPQSAYFEQYGLAGMRVLSRVLKYAKTKNLISILDVKRGDIGSTATAYAEAFLAPGDFEADSVTVSPFLGFETVLPFIDLAKKNGKGVFVLVSTSNPGSKDIQDGFCSSNLKMQPSNLNKKINKIYQTIGGFVNNQNQQEIQEIKNEIKQNNLYGSIGAVVGITHADKLLEMRNKMPQTWFLCPGLGFQGGDINLAKQLLDKNGLGAIFPCSRSITYPDSQNIQKLGFSKAVRQNVTDLLQNIL